MNSDLDESEDNESEEADLDESDDDESKEDDFPEPTGEVYEEHTFMPPGGARWEWLDDAVVQHVVRLASVLSVFVIASLDRRSRRESESRANRIFALTKAPFGLTRTVLSGISKGIHPGVECDRSGQCPIVGTRYNLRGHNFDLCQAEFDKIPSAERPLYEAIPPLVQGGNSSVLLTSCLATDEHVATLAAAAARARALTHVTSFVASNSRAPGGIGPLTQAWADGAMPRLQTLKVDSCSLGDVGLAALGDALISGTPSLTSLDLSWNHLTKASIPSLRKVGLALRLSAHHAGDNCTCSQCAEVQPPTGRLGLIRLLLERTPVGLDLTGNWSLGREAVTELRAALPTVGITPPRAPEPAAGAAALGLAADDFDHD